MSTIVPNVPSSGQPVMAAPIANNFQAAANDIDGLTSSLSAFTPLTSFNSAVANLQQQIDAINTEVGADVTQSWVTQHVSTYVAGQLAAYTTTAGLPAVIANSLTSYTPTSGLQAWLNGATINQLSAYTPTTGLQTWLDSASNVTRTVNGLSGTVTLTAATVGAAPATSATGWHAMNSGSWSALTASAIGGVTPPANDAQWRAWHQGAWATFTPGGGGTEIGGELDIHNPTGAALLELRFGTNYPLNNNGLGMLAFQGNTSGSAARGFWIEALADENWGPTNRSTRANFWITNGNTALTAMRFSRQGGVGFGTRLPPATQGHLDCNALIINGTPLRDVIIGIIEEVM